MNATGCETMCEHSYQYSMKPHYREVRQSFTSLNKTQQNVIKMSNNYALQKNEHIDQKNIDNSNSFVTSIAQRHNTCIKQKSNKSLEAKLLFQSIP